jgi:PiT family inorganic phosphate transporter
LNAAGLSENNVIPLWVRLLIGFVMGLGAFWLNRGVVKELAYKVYDLKPMHACVAELSAASILVANSAVGGPVSASQVVASSIMGTGAAERHRGIHWLVIKDILISWITTIPGSALMALLFHAMLFQWIQKII